MMIESPIAPPAEEIPSLEPAHRNGEAMGFFTDSTLCIGCKACEVACKQWNQLPADGYNWTGYSYDNTVHLSETTWRHVTFKEQKLEGQLRWLMVSDVCKHCENAPCQEACPTGAIIYNEYGNVYVQEDICNGCSYCVVACPFGVLSRSDVDGHAHKCTLCYDRQRGGMIPACAKACPTESIQYGPLQELRKKARRRVEELQIRGQKDAYLYGVDPLGDYSRLNAFFLLTDNPNEYNLPEQPRRPTYRMGFRYAVTLATGLALAAVSAVAMKTAGGSR